eukprot:1156591-Pelagomonas_calceolata.AAC.3
MGMRITCSTLSLTLVMRGNRSFSRARLVLANFKRNGQNEHGASEQSCRSFLTAKFVWIPFICRFFTPVVLVRLLAPSCSSQAASVGSRQPTRGARRKGQAASADQGSRAQARKIERAI